MDKERWQQISDLFEAAIDFTNQDERSAFLDQHCGPDTELRSKVEKLLAAYPVADSFLETPPHLETQLAITEQLNIRLVGHQLGAWHIDSLIHYGGMGAVFRAHRADGEFDQVAAIKVVQAGHLNNPAMLQKFTQERALLAKLEHHNIARLLDGGTTDDGFSYLVMEYVRGVPINQWCQNRKLKQSERIHLFAQVCAAVQYAHRYLIVHQDIKPNNILVNSDGLPKLLDFGIARLLTDDGENTSSESPIGITPGYSSPEQIQGDNITIAADIYSLGKLLSELLNNDPEPKTRNEPKQKLAPDLYAIISKAIQQQPLQRYSSVDSLLDDLQRYQQRWPVRAVPDTLGYRGKKFLSRNWRALLIGGTIATVTGVGITSTLWQSKIAEKRFDQLHTLTESLLFNVHDSIVDLSGSTKSRELIASNTLVYLNALAEDANDDPALMHSLAENYFRLGEVVGNPTNSNLGDAKAALSHYQDGLDIIRRLLVMAPDNQQYLYLRALTLRGIGDVQTALNEPTAALTTLEQSLNGFAHLRESAAQDQNLTLEYVSTLLRLGDLNGNQLLVNLGRTEQAGDYYRRALTVLTEAPVALAETWQSQRFEALLYERLGDLKLNADNIELAQELFDQSKNIRLALARQFPNQAQIVRDSGIAHERMGHINQRLNQPAEALKEYQNALAIYQQLADTEPNNDNALLTLAIGLEYVADGYRINNQTQKALDYYQRSLALYDQRIEINPNNPVIKQKRDRAQKKRDELLQSSNS